MGQNRGVIAVLGRVTKTLGLCAAITLSLLTFPNAIPWMIALWLLGYAIQVMRGRRAWDLLAWCVAVIVAKWVFWTPGLYLFVGTAAAVMLAHLLTKKRQDSSWAQRLGLATVPLLCLAWAAMFVDWQYGMRANHPAAFAPGRPVVCLGDSLTSFGPKGGYPELLAKLVCVPVLNCGEAGITAGRAIRTSLPKALAANPQAVVIELGEHEFLHGNRRKQAEENLEHLIEACRTAGAEVILMEMPRGYMFDPYRGLERELARKHDLELIPDTVVRRLLLASPTLPPGMWTNGPFLTESDGVHPNERGNQLLAQVVAKALERIYGPQIRQLSDPRQGD